MRKRPASLGAQGIGLCRTEHMFFERRQNRRDPRDDLLRNRRSREKLLWPRLVPMQQGDFEGCTKRWKAARLPSVSWIRRCMSSFPTDEEDIEDTGQNPGQDRGRDQSDYRGLHEFNPMMGHRGCRLAVTYPEIAEMQTKAVIKAAIECSRRNIRIGSSFRKS